MPNNVESSLIDSLVERGWVRNTSNPDIAHKRIPEVGIAVSVHQDLNAVDVVFVWPSLKLKGRFDHVICSSVEAVEQAILNVIAEWKTSG